jgi:hypothetical protein
MMLAETNHGQGGRIARCKLDSLFIQWFSLPESQQMVRVNANSGALAPLSGVLLPNSLTQHAPTPQVIQLLEDVKLGRPVAASSPKKKRAAPNFSAATVGIQQEGPSHCSRAAVMWCGAGLSCKGLCGSLAARSMPLARHVS